MSDESPAKRYRYSVKVKLPGSATNQCIHRYFFDRSPAWKQVREEELRTETLMNQNNSEDDDDDFQDDESQPPPDVAGLNFTPLSSKHLSSAAIVRGRVVQLLKASRNQMHVALNMLVAIVWSSY